MDKVTIGDALPSGGVLQSTDPTLSAGQSAPVPVRVGDSSNPAQDADEGLEEGDLTKAKWDAVKHRSGQQDLLIQAMIKVFGWLNGSVMVFVILAWFAGLFFDKPPIITEHVVMSLIGATVIQAGAAFILITRYLFPTADGDKADKS